MQIKIVLNIHKSKNIESKTEKIVEPKKIFKEFKNKKKAKKKRIV